MGQLGLAAWLCSLLAPAHLLISWIWGTEKSLWFLSNNWKHQRYQHSSCIKSKTQQLLGEKLSPFWPKPGQGVLICRQLQKIRPDYHLLLHLN